MKRIAILADRFPPNWGGGTNSAHYHLYRVLKKRGHYVRAFTYFDEPSDGMVDAETVRRAMPHRVVRFLRRANNLFFRIVEPGTAAYQISDILLRSWGAMGLNKALKAFAPEVMVLPDHGSPGLWIRPIEGCRQVLVAHHNPERFLGLDLLEPHSRYDVRLAARAEKRVLRQVDTVICPSQYMADIYHQTGKFDGPIRVVPNVIDEDFLSPIAARDPRPELSLADAAPLIYFPAGGNKFKGARFVLKIVKHLVSRHNGPLGIFVSGAVGAELRGGLEAMAPGIRAYIPGTVQAEDLLAIVKACSFAVYPTLVENYSMALLESVLCGVPAVTFDVGGNGEIVRHGVNGFLAPPYDDHILAASAAKLLDPHTLAKMKCATFEDAAHRLSERAIAESHEQALFGE